MRICTIRSTIMFGDDEPGFFELEVNIPYDTLNTCGDPKGYSQAVIAQHLASCVKTTGLPLNEGLWNITFSGWARKRLNYPAGFTA